MKKLTSVSPLYVVPIYEQDHEKHKTLELQAQTKYLVKLSFFCVK